MMKKLFYLLMCFLVLVSCGGEDKLPKPPEGVPEPDKMEEILYDVQIVEAIYQRGGKASKGEGRGEAEKLYQRVYEKHGIDEETFKRSYDWYVRHPKMINDMYDRILERMSEEQTLLEEELSEEEEEKEKE